MNAADRLLALVDPNLVQLMQADPKLVPVVRERAWRELAAAELVAPEERWTGRVDAIAAWRACQLAVVRYRNALVRVLRTAPVQTEPYGVALVEARAARTALDAAIGAVVVAVVVRSHGLDETDPSDREKAGQLWREVRERAGDLDGPPTTPSGAAG